MTKSQLARTDVFLCVVHFYKQEMSESLVAHDNVKKKNSQYLFPCNFFVKATASCCRLLTPALGQWFTGNRIIIIISKFIYIYTYQNPIHCSYQDKNRE